TAAAVGARGAVATGVADRAGVAIAAAVGGGATVAGGVGAAAPVARAAGVARAVARPAGISLAAGDRRARAARSAVSSAHCAELRIGRAAARSGEAQQDENVRRSRKARRRHVIDNRSVRPQRQELLTPQIERMLTYKRAGRVRINPD